MHRTTIYLEPELEMRLRAEAQRRSQPMADVIREALTEKLDRAPAPGSVHAGAFSSGRADTAERTDEVLAQTGFGDER